LYGNYKNVDSSHLNAIFQEIMEQESPLFSNYSNLLTDLQWKILIAIAKEEPVETPLSNDFTGKYQLGATSSVSSALKTLVKKEIVVKEGAYIVHDVLLMRWLQSL
jgi:DNA-binding MarR family transcriptional regulator